MLPGMQTGVQRPGMQTGQMGQNPQQIQQLMQAKTQIDQQLQRLIQAKQAVEAQLSQMQGEGQTPGLLSSLGQRPISNMGGR